jgi:predicted nucleic acid-binding protein
VIVVSDTSPITNLVAIGYLELLQQLYGQIMVPPAVYRELTRGGETVPGYKEVQTFDWITVQPVNDSELVISLLDRLDEGEAEAIALAIEQQADWLLIDEELGRQVAEAYQIRFTGILGVLIEAKHRGFVAEVKPVLDSLINNAEFWVSERLYRRVLQVVGE